MNSEGASSTADANSEKSRSRPGLLGRLWKWIDRRTGADRILRHSLDEPIPGGARFAYVFGSALLFIFVSQIVTGICLALYYAPSPMTAHASVAYIVKEVAAGAFLRSLHSYGSSAMIVVLLLHFLQTFLYGSYKGKRELLWISGCTLSLLVLGMAFTGYLLSWDQSAYSAGSVGTDIVGQVPVIGESLRLLLRGGARMGALTLSRFYVLHILIIPALIFSSDRHPHCLVSQGRSRGPGERRSSHATLACRDVLSQASADRHGVCAGGHGRVGHAGALCPGHAGTRGEPYEYPLFTPSGVVLPADVPVAEVLGGVAHGHRRVHHSRHSDRTGVLCSRSWTAASNAARGADPFPSAASSLS